MELGTSIMLSSLVVSICGIVVTVLLKIAKPKCNNVINISEKTFDEFKEGLSRWMKGIDNNIKKIFDILDKMKEEK